MKYKSINLCLLGCALLFLSGCFETQFEFKTVVNADGSVLRETKIDGRGASKYKVPSGPGWESQTSESKEPSTLIPNTYYHVQAHGKFAPGQEISSDCDYAFDFKEIDEETEKRFEQAGILKPYQENIFSRNHIQVRRVRGWFYSTLFYEETFKNSGIIPLLILDLKEEIKRQNQIQNQHLKDEEIDALARIRLEEEILPELRFQSELTMPGKIISANGVTSKGKVTWKFSMRDFGSDHSLYTLRAMSRSLRWPGVFLLGGGGILLLGLIVLMTMGIGLRQKKGASKTTPKTKRGKKQTPENQD